MITRQASSGPTPGIADGDTFERGGESIHDELRRSASGLNPQIGRGSVLRLWYGARMNRSARARPTGARSQRPKSISPDYRRLDIDALTARLPV
jgi:hypothetical protein